MNITNIYPFSSVTHHFLVNHVLLTFPHKYTKFKIAVTWQRRMEPIFNFDTEKKQVLPTSLQNFINPSGDLKKFFSKENNLNYYQSHFHTRHNTYESQNFARIVIIIANTLNYIELSF